MQSQNQKPSPPPASRHFCDLLFSRLIEKVEKKNEKPKPKTKETENV